MLAPAGPLAREQREHDAEGAVQAGPGIVGHQVEGDGGLAVALTDQAQDGGQREIVQVVRRIPGGRPALAETGERTVHDARVERANRLVIGAEPFHHARAKAFDDHVGVGGQAPEDLLALGRFHVERHRALVAVDEGKGGTALRVRIVGVIQSRRLDLQHVGAHVGEEHARHLRRRDARDFEDGDAVENAHRDLLSRGRRRGARSAPGCRGWLPGARAARRCPQRRPARACLRSKRGTWRAAPRR